MTKLELSVNKIVKNLVTNDVFLATSLKRGYLNLSAVARDLKPNIERKMGAPVQEEAIISALKRNRDYSRKFDRRVMEALAQSSIRMITPVAKFVVPMNHGGRLFREGFNVGPRGSLYISTGTEYTTIIVEDRNIKDVQNSLVTPTVDERYGLALLVLKSPLSIVDAPGFLMSLYSKLAFEGINLVETTNSYSDAVILVDQRDSPDAFRSVQELLEFARADLNDHD